MKDFQISLQPDATWAAVMRTFVQIGFFSIKVSFVTDNSQGIICVLDF